MADRPAVAPGLSSEREAELVERLHQAWHPAPNACPPRRACYERRRARGAARILGPVIAGWLAEEADRAGAAIDSAWFEMTRTDDGDCDRTRDLSGELVTRLRAESIAEADR